MSMAFSVDIPVRFSDINALGHASATAYITYLEDARHEFFAAISGDEASVEDRGHIIAHLEIDYLRSIFFTAGSRSLELTVDVSRVTNRSFTLNYVLRQHGEVAAHASTVHVAYDYTTNRPRPLTDGERKGLEAHTAAGTNPGE